MAIKFSQFVVKTSSSDLSHIVGYNGVDNIQITPTNFLNTALTGTAGQVLFFDTTGVASSNSLFFDTSNNRLGVGTNTPSEKLAVKDGNIKIETTTNTDAILTLNPFSSGIGSAFQWNLTGRNSGTSYAFQIREGSTPYLNINNSAGGSGGNVGIGTTTPSEKLEVVGNIKVGDSQKFIAGDGDDLQIQHSSGTNFIDSAVGDLIIKVSQDDGDIIFQSDDGSGAIATYFRIDGGQLRTEFELATQHLDNIKANFGSSSDLQIYHNGTDSYIQTSGTGDLILEQLNDDKDILFKSDDGSGGTATYFFLDGSASRVQFNKNLRIVDTKELSLGSSDDLVIKHNATNSVIDNTTGNLIIQNQADDGDISFKSDDGSGGATEYFRVDGGDERVNFSKNAGFSDNVRAMFGDGLDLRIYHDTSNSYIENHTNDLIIQNTANDRDIILQSDDGSGGVANYLIIDGGQEKTTFHKNTEHQNGIRAQFGNSGNFSILHDGSNAFLINDTGNLTIQQNVADADIIFKCDDGSGGATEYFKLDGSLADGDYTYTTRNDGGVITFGNSLDLRIWRDPIVNDSYIRNYTDDLIIETVADDKDIIFNCDDGGGGVTTYFFLDGSQVNMQSAVDFRIYDDKKLQLGNGADLEIYHNGSNSFISDTGTGLLVISTNHLQVYNAGISEFMITAVENGEVSLFHNGVKKLDTRTTGIRLTGVSEYADNAAAIAAGLTTGDVYRTGDLLKIVH